MSNGARHRNPRGRVVEHDRRARESSGLPCRPPLHDSCTSNASSPKYLTIVVEKQTSDGATRSALWSQSQGARWPLFSQNVAGALGRRVWGYIETEGSHGLPLDHDSHVRASEICRTGGRMLHPPHGPVPKERAVLTRYLAPLLIGCLTRLFCKVNLLKWTGTKLRSARCPVIVRFTFPGHVKMRPLPSLDPRKGLSGAFGVVLSSFG